MDTKQESMYLKIKSSLRYSSMHDGIIKFGKEYNSTLEVLIVKRTNHLICLIV